MSLAVLLVSLAATPGATPPRVADDATTQHALERSQQWAEQLLAVLPDAVRNSPRPRVQAMLDEVRHDQARVAREGRNPVFEAAVFLNYSELCRLAEEYLGDGFMQFPPLRDTSKFEFPGLTVGGIRSRTARTAFAQTLLSFEDLEEVARRSQDLIQELSKHDLVDAYQNNKWKRELNSLRGQVREAIESLRMPAQLNKIIPEAKLLGAYARLVGFRVRRDR